MLNLLYAQRSLAKRSIEHLENLVAILTQFSGTEMLCVYHQDSSPAINSNDITAITLRDLSTFDFRHYDGLLIGFHTLDELHPEFITKGPFFYSIENLYRERGEVDSLYRTMDNLSIELMRQLKETKDTLSPHQWIIKEAKALQMALPGMLHNRDCNNLVAILPVGELNRFISRKTCHYLYYDANNAQFDLNDSILNTKQNWVIAFEEMSLLSPNIQIESSHFLDLRQVLNGMQREDALQITRKSMAQLFYTKTHQNETFRQVAWSLAIEYWLTKIECEDLVAIYPHNDFESFLESGDSIRIYRNLENRDQIHTKTPSINVSLQDIGSLHFPKVYGQLVFSLPGISNLINPISNPTYYDLCKVLYKAGLERVLARSLWLLSHDLIHGISNLESTSLDTRKTILDACSRACLIYNLSDPWGWRQGRWQLYLEGAYQTRHQLLEQASNEENISDNSPALNKFYQALDLWYACSIAKTPEKNIEDMLEKLHDFQRNIQENPFYTNTLIDEKAQCDELITLAEILLNRTTNEIYTQTEIDDINHMVQLNSSNSILRYTTDLTQPLPLISPLCKLSIKTLQAARSKRQNLYTQERNIQHLIEQLEKIQSDLQKQKHQLFTPIHEERAIEYAFNQEIYTIKSLLDELESSAKLNVVLKNAWVDIHNPVHLTLEITNRGKVEANTLEMILDQPRGFQLLDPSPVREISILPPNTPSQVEYYICPERVGAELRIEYRFNDPGGQRHKDSWTTYLNVRSLDLQPFQIKVNRYQFGRPIQNISEFYGRRSELQNILSLLKAGGKQNLLLRGPRRMGKTSLLYMLKTAITNRLARRFFEIPSEWDEELDHVHPVFLSLHSFNLMTGGNTANQFFRTLLERVTKSLDIDKDDQRQIMQSYEQREREVGSVNAALEQIGELLDNWPNLRIAVLLDEYDEVYQPGTGNLDRHLREFVSAEQRLTWIIASTLALFRDVKTISSPWFNVFMIIELGRLSEDSAIDLVEAPSKEENIFWQSDAVLSLLTETGKHPAFTQLFCGRVISHLNQVKTNYVLQETILSIADQIVDEQETANNHFEFFWQDTAGTGQLILLILDDQDRPLKRDEIHQRLRQILEEKFGNLPRQLVQGDDDQIEWQEREFKSQIDWVEKITNAVTLNNQRRYFFTVPLFHRWLRRRRQYQNLKDETLEKILIEMENDGIDNNSF